MNKQADVKNTAKIECRVLGCLTSGYLKVIIGCDRGMLDGGIVRDIPVHLIPFSLRMPNSKFHLVTKYPNSSEWLRIEEIL